MRQILAELSRLVPTGTPLQAPCEPPPPDRRHQRRGVTTSTSLLIRRIELSVVMPQHGSIGVGSPASAGLRTAQTGGGKEVLTALPSLRHNPREVTMSRSEDRTSNRPQQRSRRAGPRTAPGRSPAEGRAVTARHRSSLVLQEVQSYG
jgi:hypothetical protein